MIIARISNISLTATASNRMTKLSWDILDNHLKLLRSGKRFDDNFKWVVAKDLDAAANMLAIQISSDPLYKNQGYDNFNFEIAYENVNAVCEFWGKLSGTSTKKFLIGKNSDYFGPTEEKGSRPIK
jgi:hypothetical protein